MAGTRFHDGARMHLFVFDPAEPRPLAERVRIARRAVAREGACRWIDAPRDVIEAETRRQEGALYEGTLLAAPLDCA